MYIELSHINKSFGNFQASKDVSFQIEKGRLIALLGPSGSGKTTILRMIAGLEHQDSGDIRINEKVVNNLPTHERGIGLVFQNYALFPYLTVYDNIAYGLKIQKKSKKEITSRVAELLNLVGLPGLEKRYPSQLSGGQKQRIAFARAMAPNPQVLLLDEPFAAVDAKVRKELRTWLRNIIDQIGITSIFVTHDQDEAIEVADEIIITNEGRVEQMGSPVDIYRHPLTPFVARFIGESAVIEDYERLEGFKKDPSKPKAIIRPEFVNLSKIGTPQQYESILEEGIVERLIFRGNALDVQVNVEGISLHANYPLGEEPVQEGEPVHVLISQLYTFDDVSVSPVINYGLKAEDIFYI